MKRLIMNGMVEGQAERIVVDKDNSTITGYNGDSKAFEMRGVKFDTITYTVEGGEDLPEPEETDLLGQRIVDLEIRLLMGGL